MMHRYFKSLLAILFLMVGAKAFAYDAEINGIYYNFSETEAAVTYYSRDYYYNSSSYRGNVVIPASVTYNGKTYTVTSIGIYAFDDCSSLTSVTIPEGVTSIGDRAFSGCSGLISITIPESVASIGYSAFYGCSSLTSITIPEGVTSIGSYAFDGCSGLTSVKVLITDNALFLNNRIAEQIKNSRSTNIQLIDGEGAEIKNFVVPNSVNIISVYAFYNCRGLTSITIPESVTSIGSSAFEGCSGMTSITIPESVKSIGSSVFSGCSGLTSVTINCPSIGSWFSGLTSIKEITLGNKVTSIGSSAFKGCSGLTSINIPKGMTSIGSSAFKGCSGLTSITIPESVTSIGSYAFEGCSGLTSIKIPEGVTNIGSSAFSNCSSLTSITIPESVTSIGEGAFSNCSGLTSINIPESVVSLGKGVFKDSNIDTLYISDLNKWCQIEMGENTWGKHLLLKGEEVKDVVIPEGQEKVGAYTFCGINIRSVAFPNSVKEIGDGAFKGCADLTKVVITNGVETIGSEAFMDAGLTSVVIPNSVKSIGEKAFANCIGLYSVTSLINSPFKLDPTAFTYYNKDYDANSIYYGATLYVPRGRKSFYEMIDGWKTFLKIEENDMKYKMTYYLNDEEYKTYEIQAGEVVTPEPDPVLVGCVFNGWSSIPRVMPAEDVIVKGTYTVNKYKIRYYDGDKLIAEDEVDYGAEVVLRDYTPEDAARYTFIGWDGEKYETMPAHDIEYHANIVDGVSRLERVPEGVEAIYDANGRKLRKLQRGVNVVVMSDGTKKKVVVK